MKQIPFPRPSIKIYLIAAVITGFSIAFILNVFQPFGTDRFDHPNKTLILTGYGIVAALSIVIYYWFSLSVVNKSREDRWTIIHETIDLFISLVISLLMCYFYFVAVFGLSLRLSGMIDFLLMASSVSLLPVIGLFGYLYVMYRDIRRSRLSIQDAKTSSTSGRIITLKGTNKDDVIRTNEEDVIYIKAEDNYVILHLREEGQKVGRHMIRKTMKQISVELSQEMFYQCHRSHIINTALIRSLTGNKNDTKVELEGLNKQIPVSRSKVDQLRNLRQA